MNRKGQGWLQLRIRSFIFGSTLPFRSLASILRHPELLFWSALPTLLTLAIYVTLYRVVTHFIEIHLTVSLAASLAEWGFDPTGWIAGLFRFLSRIVVLVAGAMTFSFAALVVSSIFNDFLAEAAEKYADPPLPKTSRPRLGQKIELIGIDIFKSIVAFGVIATAVAMAWIPIVNLFAGAAAVLMMTFGYTSYPQTRRGLGLIAGLGFLWRNLYACLGLGWILSLLFILPVIKIIAVPLAVVSGTLLVAQANTGSLR